MLNNLLLKKLSVILIFIVSFNHTLAKKFIPAFETTRMKATGGAGVASPLLDEANYLNPASSAFFNVGSLYVQKNDLSAESQSSGVSNTIESDQLALIASDSKSKNGGSISYNKMTIGRDEIKQIGGSLSSPVGQKSAIGASFNRLEENSFDSAGTLTERDYNITTFGVTHALNRELFLGIVLKDAFRSKANNTKALVGLHYFYKQYVNLILDVGADYKEELSQSAQWNAAAELRIMNDFMLRFGFFDDRGLAIKGNGIGVGWVQPRLTLEIALKNTDVLDSERLQQVAEQVNETTLSLSYRF